MESSSSTSCTGITSRDSEWVPSSQVKRRQRRQPPHVHWCPMCPKSFSRAQDLDRHVRRHVGNKPYRCSACDKAFCTIFELDQHMPTHTGERLYSCHYCPQAFAARSTLRNHMFTHLPLHQRAFQCSLCPAVLASRKALTVHESTHRNDWPLQCHLCSQTFPRMFNLSRHLQRHEREKAKTELLPSSSCSMVFNGKELLNAHRRTCGDFHKCGGCGKGFVLEADLKDHMARKQCSSSGLSEEGEEEQEEEGMSSYAQGREGNETSSNETEQDMSYQCISNTQPAAAKGSQCNVHMKPPDKEDNSRALKCSYATLHHLCKRGEQPADKGISDNDCSSTATPTSQVLEERSEHNVEDTVLPRMKTEETTAANVMKRSSPRYDCPECKVSFAEWDALKLHMALAHKKTLRSLTYLFQCHLCGRTFSQNSNLKTHLKSHDRVASFICDVCGEGFVLKHHLKRHNKKHSVES